MPDLLIVDKSKAEATAYKKGKKAFSFPILLSRNRGDNVTRDRSFFAQGITPATYYDKATVTYDPRLPGMYNENCVISFADAHNHNGRTELLSFHSVLSGGNQANISDGRSSNNRLSNGCIRVGYSDFRKLIDFMTPGGTGKYKELQKKGVATQVYSKVHVVVLPEIKRDYESTMDALDL